MLARLGDMLPRGDCSAFKCRIGQFDRLHEAVNLLGAQLNLTLETCHSGVAFKLRNVGNHEFVDFFRFLGRLFDFE